MVEDSNDKIVVAGYSTNATDGRDMAVWRYTSAGVLDTSFGNGGVIIFNGEGDGLDEASAVLLDASDNIIVAGYVTNANGDSDMAVWRFTPSGIPDTGFGEDYDADTIPDGYTIYNSGLGNDDFAADITLDASGRILVTGATPTVPEYDMTVLRLTAAGKVDTTFGTGGKVKPMGGTTTTGGNAITLDASGRMLIAGYYWNNDTGNADLCLWRLTADGALDATFGEDYDLDVSATPDGYVLHDNAGGAAGNDYGYDVAIDANNNILITGESAAQGISPDMTVWRFTSSGVLDTTFNSKGFVTLNSAAGADYDAGQAITLDLQGRIVVTGSSWDTNINSYMVLWRINSSGAFDSNFGDNGVVTITGPGGDDVGKDVIVDTSGDILVTGTREINSLDMAIWRYFSD
jgi:uncharacterized delta-60 repeat protein